MKGDNIIIGIVASLIIALLIISGCSTQTGKAIRGNEDNIVKIGVIVPLTGDASQFGEAYTKAVKIVEKEYADKNTYFTYKFIFEDDQLENAKTVTAFHKLNDIDGINALVTFSSGTSNAIAPLAEQSKIVTCGAVSDPNVVKDKKYIFKHWVTPEVEAAKYVEEAKSRGFKTIGIIITNQQGIVVTAEAVKKAAQGMVIFEDVVEPTIDDFRTVILKAQSSNPDTILVQLFPGQLSGFMRQAQELGYKGDISSVESFEFEQDALPYLEGKWYVNSGDAAGAFKQEYEAEFNSNPLYASGNAYDCMKLLIQSYEFAKSKNPDSIVEQLHQVKDYEGAMGTLYVDSSNSIQSEAAVKEIRNGQFVVVDDKEG